MATVPDRVTVLFGASVWLSVAVSHTDPAPSLLFVAPAGIVSTLLVLREKSLAVAPVPAVAATVMVVTAPEAAPRPACTRVLVFSAIVVLTAVSVTAGASSSSVIVPVPLAVAMVSPDGSASARTTVSLLSCVSSPVTDTVTVLLVSPAAK